MPDQDASARSGAWNTTADGVTVHEADAVFEGGGVKGIGLAAALTAFDARGYTTWRNLAGTSAGAIMAAYIAVGHTAQQSLDLVKSQDWASFEDWGHLAQPLINFERLHGLCRGEVFRNWMAATVDHKTFADVWDAESDRSRLKMIATDITRRRMLVLPDDLASYRDERTGAAIDPKSYPIADAVRMSMSIPYFFAPCHLTRSDAASDAGEDDVGAGTICTIVDGGVLSNFPVWLFDVEPVKDPSRPTFGFFITGGKGVGAGFDRVIGHAPWEVRMAIDMFHTASGAWDTRFHSTSTTVRTCMVPVDGLGTTDFARAAEFAPRVIADAVSAADGFLDDFRLQDYRNTHGKTVVAAGAGG